MSGLEISKNDVYETGLKYDYVKEKLENHKDLKDLYGQVLGLGEKDSKKIEDLSGVKNYLDSIKTKSWNEIKQEGATWAFAVQLFLKSQGLYEGKIDGLYMTSGQPESKTREAVRKFQEAHGLKNDGRAGTDTITKMVEVMNEKPSTPEMDIDKILANVEIADEYKKLNPVFQGPFKEGNYIIDTKEYSYKIIDKQLHRTNKPVGPVPVVEEVLQADGKGWIEKKAIAKQEKKEEGSEVKAELPEGEKTLEKTLFSGSVDTWLESDMMEYIYENYAYKPLSISFSQGGYFDALEKYFLSKNKEKISKDVNLCIYMLYKSMQGPGTNEKLVSRVLDNYAGSFKSLFDTFGKIKGKDLIQWLNGEYSVKEVDDLLKKQIAKAKTTEDTSLLQKKIDENMVKSNEKKDKREKTMEAISDSFRHSGF